jgi:hypothetical protein
MNRLNCFLKFRFFSSKDISQASTIEQDFKSLMVESGHNHTFHGKAYLEKDLDKNTRLQNDILIPRYRFYLNDRGLIYDQHRLDEFEQNVNDRKKIWKLTCQRYGPTCTFLGVGSFFPWILVPEFCMFERSHAVIIAFFLANLTGSIPFLRLYHLNLNKMKK